MQKTQEFNRKLSFFLLSLGIIRIDMSDLIRF